MSTAINELEDRRPILLRTDREQVATLTLNRPAQFNALSEGMLAALQVEFDRIGEDKAIRVVVLAAAGKAFCGGHDLKEMRARPDQEYYDDLFRRCSALMLSIVRLPQPVIARVQGVATAAGCQLVATCDLAVAAASARFAVSGVNLGLFCSTPSVALARNLQRKKAFEMLVTGDFIGAEQAQAEGLVNRVVADADLDAGVKALTDSIRAKAPVAVETGKRMFYSQVEKNLEDAYRYAGSVMACNMMAADTQEGIAAFIDKRPPNWRD